MAMISKSCEYGLRAVLYVASRKTEEYLSIREIADTLGISFHFLTKILQRLTEQGILQSYRGPSGGVTLARPPTSVTLLDVITAIEGVDMFSSCILGLSGCGEHKPCPLHQQWAKERVRLKEVFRTTTLATMSKSIRAHDWRLSDL
jgi:Rrf2 family protein